MREVDQKLLDFDINESFDENDYYVLILLVKNFPASHIYQQFLEERVMLYIYTLKILTIKL